MITLMVAGGYDIYAQSESVSVSIGSAAPEEELEIVEKIFQFDIRKDRYIIRDPIFIDGYVDYIKHPPYINIEILDGNNQRVENVYVFPGKDNYFFYHTKALPSWLPAWEDMTYTVRVTYDGHSEEKYFDLVHHSKNYDPQSVESLQTQLANANIKNHNLLQKIEELNQQIILKQEEMDAMFCYKAPV